MYAVPLEEAGGRGPCRDSSSARCVESRDCSGVELSPCDPPFLQLVSSHP